MGRKWSRGVRVASLARLVGEECRSPGHGEIPAPSLDVLVRLVRHDLKPDEEIAHVGELNHETSLRLVHGDGRRVWTSDVGQ